MHAGKDYGVRNAGYYAMRHLRIEKFFAYWGLDLHTSTTPMECGREFRVKLDVSMECGREFRVKLDVSMECGREFRVKLDVNKEYFSTNIYIKIKKIIVFAIHDHLLMLFWSS